MTSGSRSHTPRIALFGAGVIGEEYYASLISAGVCKEQICIFGAGGAGSKKLSDRLNIKVRHFSEFSSDAGFNFAIVAVPIESLSSVCLLAVDKGVERILVEKPVSLERNDLELLRAQCQGRCRIYVALNRRHYKSVIELERRLSEDGGLRQLNFSFTERLVDVEGCKHSDLERTKWGLANSIHVTDLACHLLGGVKSYSFEHKTLGAASRLWCRQPTLFSGAGVGANGALFSYQANWGGGGRWSIVCSTDRAQYTLSPLESLVVMDAGSFAERSIISPSEEVGKPGFRRMVDAFLSEPSRLTSLESFMISHEFTSEICGYGSQF